MRKFTKEELLAKAAKGRAILNTNPELSNAWVKANNYVNENGNMVTETVRVIKTPYDEKYGE